VLKNTHFLPQSSSYTFPRETMSDRFNMAAQIEHMQMKYTGTGHPDISKLYVSSFSYRLVCAVRSVVCRATCCRAPCAVAVCLCNVLNDYKTQSNCFLNVLVKMQEDIVYERPFVYTHICIYAKRHGQNFMRTCRFLG
jgi:hypothetical protein